MITLRPVCPEDEAFLYQLYASTRADEMARSNWPAAQQNAFLHMQFNAQRQSYALNFPQAASQLILSDEVAIGRLLVNRAVDEILLVDIALLPAYRNGGIGTSLIQALQDEAAMADLPIRLHVAALNPALRLYHRLGFTRIGESPIYLELEWRPLSAESHRAADDSTAKSQLVHKARKESEGYL